MNCGNSKPLPAIFISLRQEAPATPFYNPYHPLTGVKR
jgi:hypothetical protein